MITWISKAVPISLALLLGACESIGSGNGTAKPGQSQALAKAALAEGDILLLPPRGFCIDRSSVKSRFALLARCDALGGPPSASLGAPVALITVSLLEAEPVAPLPTPGQTAVAAGLAKISNPFKAEDMLLYRAEGPVPVAGLDPRHWRGTARAKNFIVGVALYGPPDSRAQSNEGRAIVRDLMARTIAAN